MPKNRKIAFTLAETLIALTIIGVVSALTIPNIVKNYQERELASRYKKFYSTMLQVNAKAIQDNGPMKTWRYDDRDDFFNKYLKPYLKIAKKCPDYPSTDCGRFEKPSSFNTVSRIYLLEDGTWISFQVYPTKDKENCSKFVCGGIRLWVDLNSEKGPNKNGIDFHTFEYTTKQEKFDMSQQGKELLKK